VREESGDKNNLTYERIVIVEWRKLNNEDIYNFYSSLNIYGTIN